MVFLFISIYFYLCLFSPYLISLSIRLIVLSLTFLLLKCHKIMLHNEEKIIQFSLPSPAGELSNCPSLSHGSGPLSSVPGRIFVRLVSSTFLSSGMVQHNEASWNFEELWWNIVDIIEYESWNQSNKLTYLNSSSWTFNEACISLFSVWVLTYRQELGTVPRLRILGQMLGFFPRTLGSFGCIKATNGLLKLNLVVMVSNYL